MILPCASCSNDRRSKSSASEQSAAAADGLGRILRKGLQDILDKDRIHWVAALDIQVVVGAAWSNSRHTAPEEEEQVRQEGAHHAVHLGEGRGTGDTAHHGEEDQAVEDHDHWRWWATEREHSCWAPVSDQLEAARSDPAARGTTVGRCRE